MQTQKKNILKQYLSCYSRLPGILLILVFSLTACENSGSRQQEPVFKQLPEIQEIKPERPAKIKLKRNSKDSYAWEISGDDVEEIIRTDKRLREGVKEE